MARQDDHPENVEVRWDPPYSDQDFVPDRDRSYTELGSDYGWLSSSGSSAKAELTNVFPKTWTGGAANACQTYLNNVVRYITDTMNSLDTASKACGTAAKNMSDAVTKAKGGVKKANDAQTRHQQVSKDRKHNALNWLNPVEYVDDGDAFWDLTQGVRQGNDARGDALNVDKQFMRDIDDPDHKLSTSKAPEPPDPHSLTDPDQAALLSEIMQPVAANLKAAGDTARAQDAVTAYENAVQNDPDKAKKLLAQYADSLSPAEFNYLLDHIDEDDLAKGFNAMDPTKDRDLYNQIAAKADPDILARLGDTDPNHYWHPATGGDQYIWSDDGFQPGQQLDANPNDVRQGGLGDCHDMSALASIEQAHPGYLESHVQANANGTYTVTLYKDGKPVQVVVTPDVPYMNDSNGDPTGSAYAHGSGNGPNIYQIYEKALAQTNQEFGVQDGAGYKSLNGGNPANDWKVITGQGGTSKSPGDYSPQDLANQINGNHPVTAGTHDFDNNPTPNSPDGHKQEVIGDHSYRVVSVNSNGNPPTVTLANPWDPTNKKNGTITLTWDQFKQYYGDVEVGP